MIKRRKAPLADAELDITSFMNLMIVLVPVLLLSLVFAQIRVLNIQLPALTEQLLQQEMEQPQQLELAIYPDRLRLNYPAGEPLRVFELTEQGKLDFAALSLYLQDLKLTFQQKNIEKQDITILAPDELDYQTLVTAMDTVRSFKAVVAADVVDAELFPFISLGELPQEEGAE
ncbi:biopolymer transporter ExbD [Rheinheimera baltica]|uniref:Biopolymer transporter ExbD n=1 Tax=Rheinheimera baltica TaxID=67576 RepID=A0ABT9HW10_9GAMM|nr:biopolymer transporter ExbD [Rheinheimera baltica]MDP5135291.1 biopolymer transporter ExbD [Rheinheimera baltica]MDP5191971.1 biopolymer transporter ExbD [Rheinheimera baltica]